MRARLTLEAGEAIPRELELLPGVPTTMGRSRDSSVILKDDLASRLHAKVFFEDGRWMLRDFGLNGTRIGNQRVSGAAELIDGSLIRIGEIKLRFSVASTPTSGGSASRPTDQRTGATPGRVDLAQSTTVSIGSRAPATAPRNSDVLHATKITLATDCQHPALVPSIEETKLRADDLTALCRYMTEAVHAPDPADLIRLALRTIMQQTSAKIAGYLSLDPTDPMPRFILPDNMPVDVTLSKRLTERVRTEKSLVWLFNDASDEGKQRPPTESLSAYQDAIGMPLSGNGEAFAALHVYRTGIHFSDRDVRFVEAIGGYLSRSLELHRHRRALEAENQRLRAAVPSADELIGDSSAMMQLRSQIARAAPQPFTVLINGESGSGKELVAQALHRQSSRFGGPLVVVNCAAIAPTLLEAELFGYRKGAFSGADQDHPGLFEQADEGTLFLDEVGELTLECQAKLLRVIEGKPFRPVGGTADVKVDVRVIAATNKDLEKESKAGRFRQDLMFRLRVIPVIVPPLRDHAEDIPELAHFFLERLSIQCRRAFRLTPAAMRKLISYSWPGNVRQLRAVLESSAVMCDSDTIDAGDLPLGHISEPLPVVDLPPSLDVDALETWAIRKAIKQTHGNVSKAAQILGMSRDTLHTKLKKKGIDRESLMSEHAASESETLNAN